MPPVPAAAPAAIDDLARRHGFSPEAVAVMVAAMARGGGQAQFSHPEFGGSGQWMPGMTMVGDMFNGDLRGRVDALCRDIAASATDQSASATGAGTSGKWWPGELGTPSSAGSQGEVRYAWFAEARRLVIDRAGALTVYDTGDHRIGRVSQQHPHGLAFSSQHGAVDVASLAVVPGAMASGNPPPGQASPDRVAPNPPAPGLASPAPELATIEKLADLHRKGGLSDGEFAAKKAELLARL